ncbi:MAG TPA: cytochrome c maturation protein CcmE [Gaiellales bacterium]|jgi:cytochrome c-type biogenesis protein CcmE|nr:cytochrome c maturation protein CcmE [Gaiellales bacterium]
MTAAPRLVIALAVAALLAVFLVYQVARGSGQLIVTVSQLRADKDGAAKHTVQLTGTAVSCERVDCATAQAPFTMVVKDEGSTQTVPVRYTGGSVPDAFQQGRRIIVTGHMVNGQFEANPDSLITKCPSKYSGGGSGA